MPGPLTPSRRRVHGRWGVVAVVALGGLTGLGGCDSGPDAGTAAPTAATASAAPGGPAGTARTAAAISDLLRARAAAVVAGDEEAFAATVADGSAPAGRRQLDSFGAARALRVSRLEVGPPTVDGATTVQAPMDSSQQRVRARAEVRYRVDDLDRGDRVARLEYDLVRTGAGWRVEAERPVGAGATAPWVAMPTLRVRRGEHGVVAGTVPLARLSEHAADVDRALPALGAQWERTPARVLVLAPAREAEADALLGRPAGSSRSAVAATTEGPTGADGHRDRRPRRARPHGVRPAHAQRP